LSTARIRQELEAAVRVALGDRDHQPHVRLDHLLLRLGGGPFTVHDLPMQAEQMVACHLPLGLERLAVLLELLELVLELHDLRVPEPRLALHGP